MKVILSWIGSTSKHYHYYGGLLVFFCLLMGGIVGSQPTLYEKCNEMNWCFMYKTELYYKFQPNKK